LAEVSLLILPTLSLGCAMPGWDLCCSDNSDETTP
jgi:hypothetical protein